MADENNMTASENSTTEAPAAQTGESTSPNSSTTAPADDAPKGDTILGGGTGDTPKPDADKGDADSPKPDADKSAEGDDADKGDVDKKDEEAKADPFRGAPEGDYDVKLPEGVTVDKEALDFIAPLAKEMDLSNDAMNKLAGVYAEKVLPHVTGSIMKAMENDVAEQSRAWATETRALVEGGKDKDGKAIPADPAFKGKSFSEVAQIAHKAVRRFGGDALADYLETTKLGNSPLMVKAMFLAGSSISEETTFDRSSQGQTKKSLAETFYPSS